MKQWISALSILLALTVLLSACVQVPIEPTKPPTEKPTEPPTIKQPTEPPTEPPTELPSEMPTELPTEPTGQEVAANPLYIPYYYSFTSAEIAAAKDAVETYLQSDDPDADDMMDDHVFSVAYDPELTSQLLHQQFGAENASVADQYIAFSFFYRGTQETEGGAYRNYTDTGYVLCYREHADAAWAVAEYSETGGDPTALPTEYLPAFGVNREVVAGYTQGIDGLKVFARYELSAGYYRTLAYTLDQDQLVLWGTDLTESELEEFENLFDIRKTEDPWFIFALTSEYADPADVDIFALMYSAPDGELSQADKDFATQNGLIPEILNKYPADTIDAQLGRLFGIALDETNGVGLEQFAYDPDTDCYYDSHGDSKLSHQNIIGGVRMANGDVAIYYERQQVVGLNPAQAQMVVLLRPVGDRYQILMNVRAGLGYEFANYTVSLPDGYTLEDLVTPITRDLDWSTTMIQSGVVQFSVPHIYPFSADAVLVQQRIQEQYLRVYQDTYTYYLANKNFDMLFAPHYCEIRYEATLNGEILSIVIITEEWADSTGYAVYNFDLETGKLLNNEELLQSLGIDPGDYRELLGSLVSKAFTDKYGEDWDPESALYDIYVEQKERNDSPENIAAAKLYLDADGRLWAICNVYSLAGAGVDREAFSLWELMP